MNWCCTHNRIAANESHCDPKLGGIMMPCQVVERPPGRLNMPVYIFGCARRPSLTLDALRAYNEHPTFHTGTDYALPRGTEFNSPYHLALNQKTLAHYRVFRGHQDMAARFLREHIHAPAALMMEDDAVPNCADWVDVVNAAADYFVSRGTDTMCLHARSIRAVHFTDCGMVGNRVIYRLRPGVHTPNLMGGSHHLYGFTLAYLINRHAATEFANGPAWTGIPVDCYLPDHFGTELMMKSPFNHDRSQGSLVDGKYRPRPKATIVGTPSPSLIIRPEQ
jgi:hypothetical protein